ncbi:MAG: nitrilase family protein [Rikenellaceae bacterium]|nr:nitrilase family protein [Rikenellaceae bacterium]
MKITICQTDIIWKDIDANLAHVEEIVEKLGENTDMAIFPEMFLSGFSMDASQVAVEMNGPVVGRLRDIARRHNIALMGSLAVIDRRRDGSSSHVNRLLFIAHDGTVLSYDKRHLFGPAGESEHYTAGHDKCIIHYKGIRILPLICYDLRFPVWSRCRGDYDLLVYVASWPDSRSYVWQTLLRARAIENLCYTIGVNRVGFDPKETYRGYSIAVNCKGMPVARAKEGREDYVTFTVDRAAIDSFRQKFHALDDADDFTIEPD